MSVLDLVFLLVIFLSLLLYLTWGFRNLPGESRQMLAALPVCKRKDGSWAGLNITWYGLLVANAVMGAAALFILLAGGLGWNTLKGLLLIGLILALALLSARIIARWVERKSSTFTTSGAFTVGLVVALPGVILINQIFGGGAGEVIDPMTALTVLMIAYVFGEGLGRLACISFGCCYGKRVEDCAPWLRYWGQRFNFTFRGETKKIAYAQEWEGVPVIPVQGITALILAATGLVSLTLFLSGHISVAFLAALVVSQGWRVISESLRSDHRGGGVLTTYQIMSLVSIIYGAGLSLWFGTVPDQNFNLLQGLEAFKKSTTLLFLGGLWMLTLFYMGRSQVTGSSIRFHVNQNRI